MSERNEYDELADIWHVWIDSASEFCRVNQRFYVEQYLATEGLVVELGVGDGRIALEAVRQGKPMIGIDSSEEMLRMCAARAREAELSDGIRLSQADFRDFELDEPAALISIPWHSIGHLLGLEEKRRCFSHVREQLLPGGRLVFDHFVLDRELMQKINGVTTLRAGYVDPGSGRDSLLWNTTSFDPATQGIRVLAISEELDDEGVVVRRKVRTATFSWIEPQQTRTLLEETGFEVEALYGDFARTPFDESSDHQVWIARR